MIYIIKHAQIMDVQLMEFHQENTSVKRLKKHKTHKTTTFSAVQRESFSYHSSQFLPPK